MLFMQNSSQLSTFFFTTRTHPITSQFRSKLHALFSKQWRQICPKHCCQPILCPPYHCNASLLTGSPRYKNHPFFPIRIPCCNSGTFYLCITFCIIFHCDFDDNVDEDDNNEVRRTEVISPRAYPNCHVVKRVELLLQLQPLTVK